MTLLTPDAKINRVEDITVEMLKQRGIKSLLIDVDNTLVSRDSKELTPSVAEWIEGLKAAGFTCCLLSNNWHQIVFEYAESLELPIIYKAMKPLPVSFIKALVKIGAHRASTVVVGDQLFTDILGARLCEIPCILVEPLSTTDLWYTKIFRRVEDKILGK